jgi:hypothetical protein
MTKLTEEDVQHWVEHGGPTKGRLRATRVEMANLWRDGLITLTRTEDGEIRGRMTELGRSVADAQDQEDAPVCWRCGKSSGAIKKYMVTNTATGQTGSSGCTRSASRRCHCRAGRDGRSWIR